jgi:hypothetical protein
MCAAGSARSAISAARTNRIWFGRAKARGVINHIQHYSAAPAATAFGYDTRNLVCTATAATAAPDEDHAHHERIGGLRPSSRS